MTSVSIESSGAEIIDQYIAILQEQERYIVHVVTKVVSEARREMSDEFAQEPDATSSTITFTTPLQRRFVMRAKRLGLIPNPFFRSHDISSGWRFEVLYTVGFGVSVSLTNNAPGVNFVEGLDQQPWLRSIGWLSAESKADKWRDILSDRTSEALADEFGNIEVYDE